MPAVEPVTRARRRSSFRYISGSLEGVYNDCQPVVRERLGQPGKGNYVIRKALRQRHRALAGADPCRLWRWRRRQDDHDDCIDWPAADRSEERVRQGLDLRQGIPKAARGNHRQGQVTGPIRQSTSKEHAMRITRIVVAAIMVGSPLALAGCLGGGADVEQHISTVSKGKELEDLKRALDEGAIDQKDYEKVREKILKRQY